MTSIEAEAKKKGLMALKAKRKDVIKLYYFIGTELKPFVDGLKLPKGDKHHIWNPINYHAKRLKLEGEVRLKRGQGFSNTWNNCYLLTKYKESDVFEYDWTQWVEIFDSTITQNEPRIIDWLIKTKKKHFKGSKKQDWFRLLMRTLRAELSISRRIETSFLTKKELLLELNACRKKFTPLWKKKLKEIEKKPKSKKTKAKSKKTKAKNKRSVNNEYDKDGHIRYSTLKDGKKSQTYKFDKDGLVIKILKARPKPKSKKTKAKTRRKAKSKKTKAKTRRKAKSKKTKTF